MRQTETTVVPVPHWRTTHTSSPARRASGEVGRWRPRTLPTSRPNRLDELGAEPHMTPPIVTTAFAAEPISACPKAIRVKWDRPPTLSTTDEPPSVWPLLSLTKGTALQSHQLPTRPLGHIAGEEAVFSAGGACNWPVSIALARVRGACERSLIRPSCHLLPRCSCTSRSA